MLAAGPASLPELADLMRRNFALRRRMYGDAALGRLNLEMVATAEGVGAGVKFCGSGGAVVVLCPDGDAQAARLAGAPRRAAAAALQTGSESGVILQGRALPRALVASRSRSQSATLTRSDCVCGDRVL